MKNIELFNLSTAEIFSQCYSSFPIPIKLNALEIGSAVQEYLGNKKSEVIDTSDIEFQIATHAIMWLKNAEYIDYSRIIGGLEFNGAVLTSKGLEVLNAVPESLSKKETIGEMLQKGAKEIAKETAIDCAKKALAIGISLASNVV